MEQMNTPQVRIVPWDDGDLDLFHLLNGTEMTLHFGGPETEEKLLCSFFY